MLLLFCTFLFLLPHAEVDCYGEWKTFKQVYQKEYLTATHEASRMRTFCQNLVSIERINQQQLSWKAGVNEYTDLNWDEFKQAVGILSAPQNCSATLEGSYKTTLQDVPMAKDWRNETCGETSCVSMVKNQGNCGSCWTFSTVGTLEAAHAIKTNRMALFSEQQLVDCAQDFNNMGCNGGLPSQAFEYIQYNGGLDSMNSYPYVCGDGHCKPTSGLCRFTDANVAVKVTSSTNFTMGDEMSMKEAVGSLNPISVAFEVVEDFNLYVSGVYTSTTCKSGSDTVNHAVVAVGYGVDDGMDYWIIKNSWGAGWGMEGYFNMERGVNMCGVATCSSFPVVAENP